MLFHLSCYYSNFYRKVALLLCFLVFIDMSIIPCFCMDSPKDVLDMMERLGHCSDDLEIALAEFTSGISDSSGNLISAAQDRVSSGDQSLENLENAIAALTQEQAALLARVISTTPVNTGKEEEALMIVVRKLSVELNDCKEALEQLKDTPMNRAVTAAQHAAEASQNAKEIVSIAGQVLGLAKSLLDAFQKGFGK